jgi:hypothetical protein
MTDLLLQPAADSKGRLTDFDFDVIADGEPPVGRIILDTSGLVWFWIMDAGLMHDRDPTDGRQPTREAAMQAFARSGMNVHARKGPGNISMNRGLPRSATGVLRCP